MGRSKKDLENAKKAAETARKNAEESVPRVVEEVGSEPEAEAAVEPAVEPEVDSEPEAESDQPAQTELEAQAAGVAGGFAKLAKIKKEQREAIRRSRRRQHAARRGEGKGLSHIQRAALKAASAPQVIAQAEKLIADMSPRLDRVQKISRSSLAKAHNAANRRDIKKMRNKIRRTNAILRVANGAPPTQIPAPPAAESEGEE